LDASGNIVVMQGGSTFPAVFSVDPATGNRTVVSSSSVGSGPNFTDLGAIDLDSSGNILVSNVTAGSDDGIWSVDPATGNRTILSNSGNGSGTNFIVPLGFALDASGNILIADSGVDALFSVDPATGNRTIISSSSVGSGPNFGDPYGVALEASGNIVVGDSTLNLLFRVDPMTGDRTIISSSSVGTGTNFIQPLLLVTVIPEPATLGLLLIGGGLALLRRRRK
jgi:streptogramin lyase